MRPANTAVILRSGLLAASRRMGTSACGHPSRRRATRAAPQDDGRGVVRKSLVFFSVLAGRPEHVPRALVVGVAARDEQEIGEPVDVFDEGGVTCSPGWSLSSTMMRSALPHTVRARCRYAAAGLPPGRMKERTAPIQREFGQSRLQASRPGVGDVNRAPPAPSRTDRGLPQRRQVVLDAAQHRIEAPHRLRCAGGPDRWWR